MFRLMVVYDNGKRYLVPFEVLERHVAPEVIEEIKQDVLKEIQKL